MAPRGDFLEEVSRAIGVRGGYINAGTLSWCRRPRVYWLRGFDPLPGGDLYPTETNHEGGVILEGTYVGVPPLEPFLERGAAKLRTYAAYLRAAGGLSVAVLYLLLLGLWSSLNPLQSVMLKQWMQAMEDGAPGYG